LVKNDVREKDLNSRRAREEREKAGAEQPWEIGKGGQGHRKGEKVVSVFVRRVRGDRRIENLTYQEKGKNRDIGGAKGEWRGRISQVEHKWRLKVRREVTHKVATSKGILSMREGDPRQGGVCKSGKVQRDN